MSDLRVEPCGALRGEIRVGTDKSISHRAVLLGAIADGTTHVRNLLDGEDVRATVAALRRMGVAINLVGDAEFTIDGVGLRGLSPPRGDDDGDALDLANSGTALRLLAGVLCGQRWASRITGDASLRARPMARIIEPLTQMGAVIESDDGCPPLAISPSSSLRGIAYRMPIASAQVKSCILLAGLYAQGSTSVSAPAPSRDHTERMLERFGCRVAYANGSVGVIGGSTLRGCEIEVPADLSSAAFFIVGASIIGGSDILLRGVGVNPSRDGVITILKRMGADIELRARDDIGGEPVADLRVRASALRGCTIGGGDIALAIDELPVIAVAAAFARGDTEIRDAAELRVKESDRIRGIAAGLAALGVGVEERADGMIIHGRSEISGGRVDSCGDHRLAMAFAIAGGAARDGVEIADCDCIATSFPQFARVAADAGLRLSVG